MAQASGSGRKELEQRLIQKAQEDPGFRSSLVSDPRGAIEQEIGSSLPSSPRIQVLEESADSLYLVLPAAGSQAGAGGELSDSELESVAGGWGSGGSTTQSSCGNSC